jgi:hypothetical protein
MEDRFQGRATAAVVGVAADGLHPVDHQLNGFRLPPD